MPLCGGKLTLTEVISGPPGLDDTGFAGCSAVMAGATVGSGATCVSCAARGQQESNKTASTLSGFTFFWGIAYLPIFNQLHNIAYVPEALFNAASHSGGHAD
jgi:hypothetical protein